MFLAKKIRARTSIFTKKELQYIQKLTERNLKKWIDDRVRPSDKFLKSPLERPMNAKERKLRQRIRFKTKHSVMDVVKVFHAGILPYRKLPDETPEKAITNAYEASFKYYLRKLEGKI